MPYFKLLNNLCYSSVNSEYSLYYKYSPSTNSEDWAKNELIYSAQEKRQA